MSEAFTGAVRDLRTAERRLSATDARVRAATEADVVIDGPRRLMLRSPDGTYWAVSVDNAGALATTNMGTTL